MAEEKSSLLLEEEKEFKKQYKRSLWWVEHRAGVIRLGYGLFFAFDAILILFVLWSFLDSYAISYDRERRAVESMVTQGSSDLRAYTQANAAEALDEEEVRVFATGDNHYDLFAMVSNPNQDWWVEADYSFLSNGTETPKEHVVFLPGERKPLANLAVTSTDSIRTTSLLLSNITWHRIDHHEIGDYDAWYEKRSKLEIIDPMFVTESTPEKTIGVSSFSVMNHTAFSFFHPTFYVLLKQGSSVVGVNRVSIVSLDSLEQKNISLNWFGTLPGVTTIEVIPDINLLDPSVYKQAKGALGGDVRTRPVE